MQTFTSHLRTTIQADCKQELINRHKKTFKIKNQRCPDLYANLKEVEMIWDFFYHSKCNSRTKNNFVGNNENVV
jgi:hypothetical protein